MRKTVYKSNGTNIRYYRLEIFQSLFGEYVVEREYGNRAYRAPTGIRRDIFSSLKSAEEFYVKMLRIRKNRGYKCD